MRQKTLKSASIYTGFTPDLKGVDVGMQKPRQQIKIPAGYIVPVARLNYFEPKEPDNYDGMPHKDEVFRIPCEWIVANASRFYFTNAQIIDAAMPDLVEPDENPRCRLRVVYFLIYGGEIIYVGQSSCPSQRMEQHRENGIIFDSVTWFEVPALHINDIEAFYIWRCNPIMNNKWPIFRGFGEEAKRLDEIHGEKRSDAQYVITISPRTSLPIGRKPSATPPAEPN